MTSGSLEKITAVESAEIPENEACELRTRHNALAHISQLPPEILADIFVYCVPTSIPQLQTDLSWLNVAQVTSRWRTIALACPDLWSSLILSRPKLTPLLLERAKNASLVVRVDLREKSSSESAELILLEYAARLGTLDIDSPQRYLVPFLANLGQADAAPRLQCVKIVNAYPEPDDHFPHYMTWLPRNLFCRDQVLQSRKPGAQPVLRLHLEWCAFPWDSGWYSHLTDLRLEYITHRPTMQDLLAILARSPALESLSLNHCSPTTRDGFPVSLPKLATLYIRSDLSESWTSGWLPGFLTIPSSVVVNISSITGTQQLQDRDHLEQAIYRVLIPALAYIPPDTYDTVDILHLEGLVLSLSHSARPGWTRILDIFTPKEAWTPMLEVRTTECLRDRLSFYNVTTLDLRASMKSPKSNRLYPNILYLWDSLGRAMPRLHTLRLWGEFPNGWLEFVLTQAMLLVGVSHFASCFNRFPQLFRSSERRLAHAWPALRCLTLSALSMEGDLYYSVRHAPSAAQLLRALLWARRKGGASIPQINIFDCTNVDADDVVGLRVLADVTWDGEGSTTPALWIPVVGEVEVEHKAKAKAEDEVKTKSRGKDDNDNENRTQDRDEDEDDDEDEDEADDDDSDEDEEEEDEEVDQDQDEGGTDESLDAYSVDVFVNMIRYSRR